MIELFIHFLKENNPSGLSKLSTSQNYRKYRFWQKGGGYDRNIVKEFIPCLLLEKRRLR